jgi:hypothetical protein
MKVTWKALAAAVGAAVVLGVSLVSIHPAAAATRADRAATAATERVKKEKPAAEKPRAEKAAAEKATGAGEMNLLLLAAGDIQCANVIDGVKLTITSDQPRLVARIQEQAQGRVDKLEQAAAGGKRAGNPQSLAGMIASGRLKASAQNTADGAVVTLSSSDATVVKELQTALPEMIAARKAIQAAAEQARQFQQMLATGRITLSVQQSAGGVTVSIASSDPRLASEIQAKLPAYFEGLAKNAKLIEQYTKPPAGAPGEPKARKTPKAPKTPKQPKQSESQ